MIHSLVITTAILALGGQAACELSDAARHHEVARRRQGVAVICHRGSSQFAHENTLEAYRATFELGADGNEMDIRRTRDGVLVCFHDDMLDQLVDGFGDVSDYDWAELQTFAFRNPGPFAEYCRIPTLEEVFRLHKKYAGLMHLDVKRPGLEPPIIALLDRLDIWDQVIAANAETAPAIIKHPRYRQLSYRASLYGDRLEVDPTAIKAALKNRGEMVIVDDPRGTLLALGRKLGRLSSEPVTSKKGPVADRGRMPDKNEQDLIKLLLDDSDWNSIPNTPEGRMAKAQSIRRRAEAAEEIRRRKLHSPQIESALVRRVQRRSLHPEWQYDGLDAASALRALAAAHSPQFLNVARDCLWRDDPAGVEVLDPRFKVPRSWTDFRTKGIVFELVEQFSGEDAQRLCRDYLQLSDEEARRIGPPQFEEAAQALILVTADQSTPIELLKHRRRDVRGQTILTCLSHIGAPWARASLQQGAPHALAYIPPGQ